LDCEYLFIRCTNSFVQRNLVFVSDHPAITINKDSQHSGITLADEVCTGYELTERIPCSSGNKVINNMLYKTDISAFQWSNVVNTGLNHVLIANNTLIGGNLFTGKASHDIINVQSRIRNNIFRGTQNDVPENKGLVFSNNNWLSTPKLAKSASDVSGDPKLLFSKTLLPTPVVRADPNWFKLQSTSPMINKGFAPPAVKVDFFSYPRGVLLDIGAYEFH